MAARGSISDNTNDTTNTVDDDDDADRVEEEQGGQMTSNHPRRNTSDSATSAAEAPTDTESKHDISDQPQEVPPIGAYEPAKRYRDLKTSKHAPKEVNQQARASDRRIKEAEVATGKQRRQKRDTKHSRKLSPQEQKKRFRQYLDQKFSTADYDQTLTALTDRVYYNKRTDGENQLLQVQKLAGRHSPDSLSTQPLGECPNMGGISSVSSTAYYPQEETKHNDGGNSVYLMELNKLRQKNNSYKQLLKQNRKDVSACLCAL